MEPRAGLMRPGGQLMQLDRLGNGLYVPSEQRMHSREPDLLKVPAGQGKQLSEDGLAESGLYVPAMHGTQVSFPVSF